MGAPAVLQSNGRFLAELRERARLAYQLRLMDLPPSCPKCHSRVLEVDRTGCVNCLLCGWTALLRDPEAPEPLFVIHHETPAEYRSRGGQMRAKDLKGTVLPSALKARISASLRGLPRCCKRCGASGHYASTCRVKAKKIT